MPPLWFRMDASEADPIWLESERDGDRIVPVFGSGFSADATPELGVRGPRGDVIAHDGTPLNPDAPFEGYFVCPMGDTVSITAP